MTGKENSNAWEQMFASLKEKGCSLDGLYFDGQDDNKCLYTTRAFKAGEEIAKVKRVATLDSNEVQPDQYTEDTQGLSTQLKASLRLIEEASQEVSAHQPYVQSMKYCGPLQWFSMDDLEDPFLEALGVSLWVEKLQESAELLKKVSDSFVNPRDADEALVQWAYSKVLSRSFTSTEGSCVMAPLCDLMNHNVDNNARIVDETETEGAFHVVAEKDIEAGQELILSYGKLDNTWLFLFYGFTLEGNPFPSANLCMDIHAIGGKLTSAFAIGDYAAGQGYPTRYSLGEVLDLVPVPDEATDPVSKEGVGLMVLLQLAQENIKHHVGLNPGSYTGPFSNEIQKIALNHLENLKHLAIFCKLCLDSLQTNQLAEGIEDARFGFLSGSYLPRLQGIMEANQNQKTG